MFEENFYKYFVKKSEIFFFFYVYAHQHIFCIKFKKKYMVKIWKPFLTKSANTVFIHIQLNLQF